MSETTCLGGIAEIYIGWRWFLKKLWYRYFCKLPTQRYHVSVNTTSAGLVQLFLYLALFYSIFGRVVSKADLFLHSKTNENIIFQKSVYLMVYFILVFQNSMYLKLVYQLLNWPKILPTVTLAFMITHGVLTKAIYTKLHLYLAGQKNYLQGDMFAKILSLVQFPFSIMLQTL